MYDAIVIGARCAGAVTAMLLPRLGHRVLMLERGAFPSDLHQGHFRHKRGPQWLAKWGLLETIAATNCPPLFTHLSDFRDFPCLEETFGLPLPDGAVEPCLQTWGYKAPRK